ncbi:hypothetical protein BT69DRAFT_1261801 [Atractiella rhizophila]|nr:hypothetical protein BT69DRAFT_1261801 [Atractiella rhizophila]
MILPFTYLILAFRVETNAQTLGSPCVPSNNKLDPSSHTFHTDCGPVLFCAPDASGSGGSGTCARKGCRKDEYPFGYNVTDRLPPMCPPSQFCPDAEDACRPLVPIGGVCELNRDGLSPFPSNSTSDAMRRTVCLNSICTVANVSLSQPCQMSTTSITGYLPTGEPSTTILTRSNCIEGLYCSLLANPSICQPLLAPKVACQNDFQCLSGTCTTEGKCDSLVLENPERMKWIWTVVSLLGVGSVAVVGGSVRWNKKRREREREVRRREWAEQVYYRREIERVLASMANRMY